MNKIYKLIEKNEKLRSSGINLIASENWLSPEVKRALASDLAGRYHTMWYGGSAFAREIIEETESLARKVFRCRHALVNPLSGNICDLAALFAFSAPGDNVAMLPFSAGGYPLGLEKFHRKRIDIPVDKINYRFNIKNINNILAKHRPSLTILGSSYIPFQHPVRDVSRFIKNNGLGTCVYDGSHVLGLVACGAFQDPLAEGAEVLLGSTHKTFFGPQGGILLTNSGEHAEALRDYLEIDLETGIGFVDNPHMNRIAALGTALEEMLANLDYGKKVVKNAKTLAKSLDELGVPVKYKARGYTESHQVFLDLPPRKAEKLCGQLEKIGVFIDVSGRLGAAELTHRGWNTDDMEEVASIVHEAYMDGPSNWLKQKIKHLADK
jgi:glycine hydroxymethyltransferase